MILCVCKTRCVGKNTDARTSPPAADESTRSIDSVVLPGDSDTEDDPTVRCPCDCNEVRNNVGIFFARDLVCYGLLLRMTD